MKVFFVSMLLATLAAAPLIAPASANHADCNGTVTSLDADDDGNAEGYIDVRDDGGVWIYQETNGEHGLQSGGAGVLDGLPGIDDRDTCSHDNPDRLIF